MGHAAHDEDSAREHFNQVEETVRHDKQGGQGRQGASQTFLVEVLGEADRLNAAGGHDYGPVGLHS
jgi:hypothetical protein